MFQQNPWVTEIKDNQSLTTNEFGLVVKIGFENQVWYRYFAFLNVFLLL